MTQYIALLHKNGRKGYGVSFPDFPGCISAGKTIEDALREGAEALALHVDGMLEDGEKIPKPRTVDAIREAVQGRGRSDVSRDDWIDFDDAIVATVPLLPPQGKSLRVQVTMDERLLARIDAVTRNRSAFLSQAALQVLHCKFLRRAKPVVQVRSHRAAKSRKYSRNSSLTRRNKFNRSSSVP